MRYVFPGMVGKVTCTCAPACEIDACGGKSARTRNVLDAICAGNPSSVTCTVIELVLGTCEDEGVQLKSPLRELIEAFSGPFWMLKLRAWGGWSGSVAVAMKLTDCPR